MTQDSGGAAPGGDSPLGSGRSRPAPTIELEPREYAQVPEPPSVAEIPPGVTFEPGEPEPGRAPPSEPPDDEPRAGTAPRRGPSILTHVAAGLLGGLVVLAGAFAWRQWEGPPREATEVGPPLPIAPTDNVDTAKIDALTSRLAALESKVAQTPEPPPSAAAAETPRPDPAVTGRIDSLGQRVGAAEQAQQALDGQLADLTARTNTLTDSLRALRGTVDANGAALADMGRKLARPPAPAPDLLARRAVAAETLRAAVARGDAFADELAVVERSGDADPALLTALKPFAASGVPDKAALARDFIQQVVPDLQRTAGQATARDGSFLDKLKANAAGLVRVSPASAPTGTDPGAVIARAQAEVAADPSAAAKELAQLPPALRAPAQPWIAKVEARAAALDASRKLAAAAVAALGANATAPR